MSLGLNFQPAICAPRKHARRGPPGRLSRDNKLARHPFRSSPGIGRKVQPMRGLTSSNLYWPSLASKRQPIKTILSRAMQGVLEWAARQLRSADKVPAVIPVLTGGCGSFLPANAARLAPPIFLRRLTNDPNGCARDGYQKPKVSLIREMSEDG